MVTGQNITESLVLRNMRTGQMGKLIICAECGGEKKHYAKGLCRRCYRHQHYQKHRDEILQKQASYYQKNCDKIRIEHQRYYQAHRKEAITRAQQWRLDNLEKARQAARDYYWRHHKENIERSRTYQEKNRDKRKESCRRWREKNPEKTRAYRRRYWQEHQEQVLIYNRCRRARKRNLPNTLTNEQMEQKLSVGYCFYCGREMKLTLDHFVALGAETNQACGTTLANSIVACQSCNSSKGDKLPRQILSQLYLLPMKEAR